MTNITNIQKGFHPFHQYPKQTPRFVRYLLPFSGETIHPKTVRGSLKNLVFVLNNGDKEKSP